MASPQEAGRSSADFIDPVLRALARQLLQGVVIVDPLGTVRLANRISRELLGLGPEGETTLESVPFLAQFRARLAAGGEWTADTTVPSRGTEVPVRVSAYSINGQGAVAGTLLLLTELTAPRFAMAERDNARKNNRAKTRTLYMVAHDLSGPITVLNGYLSLVQDGSLDVEQLRPYVPVLASQLEHMQRLLQVLLDTARLDEGSLELRLEPLDLGAFVETMVATLRPVETMHKVAVRRTQANLPVLADRVRLDSIVRNIISNAIKYSPEGTSVTCVARSAGANAVLDVIDQGPGISVADLRRLFTRFGRLGDAAAARAGVGLGLFLSRELARLHGGDLTATSEPGKGSTFSLSLPLRATEGGR